jgi:D-psicose/D-tagatose/L-ribulose 3-epimerase
MMSSIRSRIAVVAVVTLFAAALPPAMSAEKLQLRFGIAKFADYNPLADIDRFAGWGFDYSEPAVTQTMELSDADFEKALAKARGAKIRVEAMNWFLPATLKVTGPSIDRARVREYIERSLARAEALGAKVVVFGSGGARSVPDGFPRDEAWKQLQQFLRECGDHIEAHRYGMVIGIEPLRKAESNILNSIGEAWQLAKDTSHPKVRIIADFYHLAVENEDPAIILKARRYIVHCHIANPNGGRTFPKDESEDARYASFFKMLKKIGYSGRLSLEANTADLEGDSRAGLAFMKRMYEKYR